MDNNKKKKVIIISVVISILLILLIGGTIAYFGWNSDESLVDVTVSSGTGSCTKFSDNNILLEPVSTKEKGRILKITAKQEMADKAYITWDLVVNAISGLQNKTFVYELVNTTTGTVYTSSGTGNFENVKAGDTITFSSDELLDYNKDYEFTLYLWIDGTIGNNPLTMADQVFDFDISCNITGTKLPTAAQYITNLYTEADKTKVTNNSIEYNYASSVSLMNDRLGGTTADYNAGNIRYYGANPNNYIYFNCSDYTNQSDTTCEKWRIIGVFDGKVKIIRNESIENFSWDNKNISTGAESDYGENDWTTARLMKLLNPSVYYQVDANDNGLGQSLYYTAQSGTCYSGVGNATKSCDFTSSGLKNDTTRNMIEEVTWNLGGWNSDSVYSNQIYSYERGTTVYSGRPTSWTGKVALMYPSDYGYATDFTKCSQNLYNYGSSADSYACRTNDWLFNSAVQWLLTPDSSHAYGAWHVFVSGRVDYSIAIYFASGVRPVLYLNSEATIESGDGTSSLPYRLSVS